jgi:hypothetical protein
MGAPPLLRIQEKDHRPTNVELHAVAVDASHLFPERQARFLVDIGRAHTQRRHIGDATDALLAAEKLAPEDVRGHHQTREAIGDLLHLAGRRASQELRDLAGRTAAP